MRYTNKSFLCSLNNDWLVLSSSSSLGSKSLDINSPSLLGTVRARRRDRTLGGNGFQETCSGSVDNHLLQL